jgi:hypothetical protein
VSVRRSFRRIAPGSDWAKCFVRGERLGQASLLGERFSVEATPAFPFVVPDKKGSYEGFLWLWCREAHLALYFDLLKRIAEKIRRKSVGEVDSPA